MKCLRKNLITGKFQQVLSNLFFLEYRELNKYNQCPGMFLVIVPLTMNGQQCTLYVLKFFLLMKGTPDVGSKL